MSDASRVKLASIVESTFATQVTGSNLQILRIISEALKQDTTMVNSAEIRDDRQVSDVVRTVVAGSGPINFELSYGSWDEQIMAALLASAWSSAATIGPVTDVSFAASGNTISQVAAGLGGLNANQWIKISGATNSANNGYFKLLTVAAGSITVSGGTLTDEAAGASVTIVEGAQIVNGTTLSTFNIERTYSDLSNKLVLYKGFTPDQFNLTIPVDGLITGVLTYMGANEESLSSSGGTGYTAATTTEPMSAVDDVVKVLENQSTFASTAFNFTIANNLRSRLQIGNLGTVSIGTGQIDITGVLQGYFTTETQADKYLNNTATSVAVALQDSAGNGYVMDFPQVRFTDAMRVAGGVSEDVIMDLSWSAYRDSSEDTTVRIARFAA